MSKSKDELEKEIEMLIGQEYIEIPDHPMIGKILLLRKGDSQFFKANSRKKIQKVEEGSKDNELYYVVYGDGEYHNELFRMPVEDFEGG